MQGQQQQEERRPQVRELREALQEKGAGQGGIAGAGHATACPGPEAPVGKKREKGEFVGSAPLALLVKKGLDGI